MKHVLPPFERGISLPPPKSGDHLRVSALEAALVEDSDSVLVHLRVNLPCQYISLVLSPPAAAQLSHELRKAVKKYLRHNEDISQP